LEVLVSAEDDAEVRRVSIVNSGHRVREIDVTSYAELVLAPQADDVAHPAFMKLFVATEYLAEQGTLLATRRRRAPAEREIWAAHLAIVEGETVGKPEVETDRARFLGRGQSIHRPIAVTDGRPLSNTVGTTRPDLRPPTCARCIGAVRIALDGGCRSRERCSTLSTSIAAAFEGAATKGPGAGANSSSWHRYGEQAC
jgi:hypothetical protein